MCTTQRTNYCWTLLDIAVYKHLSYIMYSSSLYYSTNLLRYCVRTWSIYRCTYGNIYTWPECAQWWSAVQLKLSMAFTSALWVEGNTVYTCASQQAGQSAVSLYIANTAGSITLPTDACLNGKAYGTHTDNWPTKHLVLVSQPGVEFHTVYAATCNGTPVEHGRPLTLCPGRTWRHLGDREHRLSWEGFCCTCPSCPRTCRRWGPSGENSSHCGVLLHRAACTVVLRGECTLV